MNLSGELPRTGAGEARPENEPSKASNDVDTGDYANPENEVSRYFTEAPRQRVRVIVAGKSDQGKVRTTNEDNYLAVKRYRGREVLATSLASDMLQSEDDYAYTFAVADGMGGRDFGELASLLALRTGWELGGDEIKWTVKVNDREEEEFRHKSEIFFQLIHRTLHEAVLDNPKLRGMGTTLTICYSTGPELFVVHAGDSRAYLHREGKIKQLTHDHNMAQVLVDAGAAIAGSADARKMRHVLTNCLGGQTGEVDVDVSHEKLRDNDRLLVCSDGLNEMLTDPEIAAELTRHPVPQDACDALIALALERGARDNVTVLLAQYEFEGS